VTDPAVTGVKDGVELAIACAVGVRLAEARKPDHASGWRAPVWSRGPTPRQCESAVAAMVSSTVQRHHGSDLDDHDEYPKN